MILYFVVFTLLLVTNYKYVQIVQNWGLWQWFWLVLTVVLGFIQGLAILHHLLTQKTQILKQNDMMTPSEKTASNKVTLQENEEHYVSPWQRDLFLFWLPAKYEPSPHAPCVECLVIMPTVRYEAVQNRWRQQERASIKRDKKKKV